MVDSGFSPSDAFALGKGLLYGDDTAFSSGFRAVIASAGVTHLVAASGANLAYVLLFPQKLLGSKNRLLYQIVSLLLIWLYWSLAEQSGSLWRAMGMWFLSFLATCSGRSSLGVWNLLVWTSICSLWFRDRLFTHGYFLSSLAILGLLFSQFFKPGENNIGIIMHSKNRICYWSDLAKHMWFEGSTIFIAVEIYLWICFQSFQPMGIYTTIALQPFLPVYLALSGFLEIGQLFERLMPGQFSSVLSGGLSLVSSWQNTVFVCFYFVLQKMSQLSTQERVERCLQLALFFFFVILGKRGWGVWQRHKQFEQWRSTLDFAN
jgi:predicted membrane metal-binding protein